MHVTFEVVFPPPNWTDKTQLALLESVLPKRSALPALGRDVHVEEVVLSDVDTSRQQQRQQGDQMEEDEQGGPQVQCAQQ